MSNLLSLILQKLWKLTDETAITFEWLQIILQEYFGERMIISNSTEKSNVVTLIETASKILKTLQGILSK